VHGRRPKRPSRAFCRPGSVKVIARRLIESYVGLFHTVDHVEGYLEDGFDSLDAFLSHMWAVTVIGAPKKRRRRISPFSLSIPTAPRTSRGACFFQFSMACAAAFFGAPITVHRPHVAEERVKRIESHPPDSPPRDPPCGQAHVRFDQPPRDHLHRPRPADARLVVSVDVRAHGQLGFFFGRIEQLADILRIAERVAPFGAPCRR